MCSKLKPLKKGQTIEYWAIRETEEDPCQRNCTGVIVDIAPSFEVSSSKRQPAFVSRSLSRKRREGIWVAEVAKKLVKVKAIFVRRDDGVLDRLVPVWTQIYRQDGTSVCTEIE